MIAPGTIVVVSHEKTPAANESGTVQLAEWERAQVSQALLSWQHTELFQHQSLELGPLLAMYRWAVREGMCADGSRLGTRTK